MRKPSSIVCFAAFLGGPPPLAPFPNCGGDPTPDDPGAYDNSEE